MKNSNKPVYLHLSRMPRSFVDGKGVCIAYTRQSQWFGFPMMPAKYPLPTMPNPHRQAPYVSSWDGRVVEDHSTVPMPFICQIDCRELPEDCTALPRDGMLYIFVDLKYYAGFDGNPLPMYAGEDDVRVVYIPEDELTELDLRDDDAYGRVFEPQRITLSYDKPAGDEPDHQLLGEPEHREWEDWDEPYEGWRLLFQMDSCDGPYYHFNFMDWGVFNILIDPADLKRRDFSKAVGIILST